ncbi:PAPS reductase/FAD synthetase family protein [Bernardetia litoralis DSM 6794]|uniref:Adenosine 5'-phosphosulfate reductase n=1 Tax=Bernardetia litoralis (strain ATCC 23117 / DSM 6794 / NBRC 15988 / NCIMB 1366 / Fx l1 / Sio-4) TaxID=880071 RepID=I4AP76_BERLS|nr:phosphoadenylyl-sulfate reductase [Bernardetia litoralis]AFM05761.1 PAPS reductase/FAD synthetase family protein [Bernardetia litoralis DSM 6794]
MTKKEILTFAESELHTELSAVELLQVLVKKFPKKVCFSTSLGIEDQLITHFIFENEIPIDIFTLQTERLFEETDQLLIETQAKYKQKITVFEPRKNKVEELESQKGKFSFYDSVENRKECCAIRKIEPLNRALENYTIWVTGIRAEHSENRQNMPLFEWDEAHQMLKVHPLLHWRAEEVKNKIKKFQIPYNLLHDKGFVSIGCKPCTRAIKEGEDFRAGRWWWENSSKKECGLHN